MSSDGTARRPLQSTRRRRRPVRAGGIVLLWLLPVPFAGAWAGPPVGTATAELTMRLIESPAAHSPAAVTAAIELPPALGLLTASAARPGGAVAAGRAARKTGVARLADPGDADERCREASDDMAEAAREDHETVARHRAPPPLPTPRAAQGLADPPAR